MADIKISQLGAAIAVGDTDLVPIVSGGNTLKATAAQVKEHSIGNTNISSIGDGSVTGAISALNTDKQPKTLETPLTIGGVSKTTVEDALGGLVSENQTLANQLAPVENGTNYSTNYSKGMQFIRNNMLYEVTASSVNSSTAINTGTGGNAKLAKVIVDQIASNRTIIDGTFSTYYVASQQWRTLAELTVPSDGVYLLVANARSETSIADKTMSLRIAEKNNGTTLCGQTSQIDTKAGANCCVILNATAGQTFTYNVYSFADSQIRIDNTFFCAFKLL